MSLKTLALIGAAALSLAPSVGHLPSPGPTTFIVTPPARMLTVTGRVVDAATALPVAGVQVHVRGTSNGTLTNGAGRYTLSLSDALAGTEITILASVVGYAQVNVAVGNETPNPTPEPQPPGDSDGGEGEDGGEGGDIGETGGISGGDDAGLGGDGGGEDKGCACDVEPQGNPLGALALLLPVGLLGLRRRRRQ